MATPTRVVDAIATSESSSILAGSHWSTPGQNMKTLIREHAIRMDAAASVVLYGIVGPAADALVACAAVIGADMIYVGTHGRTGLKHALLGSVAEKVMRKSPCAVLTVRMPGHRFEHP